MFQLAEVDVQADHREVGVDVGTAVGATLEDLHCEPGFYHEGRGERENVSATGVRVPGYVRRAWPGAQREP